MRKSGTVNVSDSFEVRLAVIGSLFVLSPFGGASDVLSSFRDRRAHDGMVRIPEIQTLIAKWPVSDEDKDKYGTHLIPTSGHQHLFEGHTRT